MKALVLAGGAATRLYPLTRQMPKQLIPLANRPVLDYVLENIATIGVRDVGIVVGGWRSQIEATAGDGSRFGLRLSYLRQAAPLGLAHCVRLARSFLGDDDFLMYLGDNLLPDGIGELAAQFRATRPAAQVTVHKVRDPRGFGVAELDRDGAVRRLVEKPDRPRSDLALVGVYCFTAAIHPAVAAVRPSGRGELEITDAIQWLVDRQAGVHAAEYRGFWLDTGSLAGLLAGNRHLLGRLRPQVAGAVDPASRIGPQVVVESGARVVRSRIAGPALVGAGSLVVDSRIGPGTSLGPDCVVRGVRTRDVIVLAGAPALRDRRLTGTLVPPPPG